MKNTAVSFIVMLLAFAFAEAKLVMRPYLQAVTENSVYVVAETDSKQPVMVVCSMPGENTITTTESKYLDGGSPRKKTYIFRIKITGLKSNSLYDYTVICSDDSRDSSYFYTAAPSGVAVKFIVTGDFRSNPTVTNKVFTEAAKEKGRFAVFTGDLCFDGVYSTWKNEFFIPAIQNFISCTPFFNSLGNHEARSKLYRTYLKAPDSPSDNEDYYSFDYGDAHFLILSTEVSCSRKSKQYKFAEADLKSTKKKFKVVAFHKQVYSSSKAHSDSKEMRKVASELFEKYGVDIVFNGHSHMYQHSIVNGVHYIVTAGGGAPLCESGSADYVVKTVNDYHYCTVDLSPTLFALKVKNPSGNIIDQFEINKK